MAGEVETREGGVMVPAMVVVALGSCGAGGVLQGMRFLSVALVLLVACGPQPAPAAVMEAPVVQVEAPAPVAVVPVVEAPAVVEAPLTEAACVEYLASYRRCIGEMTGSDAQAHTLVVAQLEASWRSAQADTKVAGTLAGSCGAARAASELSLPACKHW